MERKLVIRAWKFIRNAVTFVLAFAVLVMMLPTKARSQLGLDPCCAIISVGLTTVTLKPDQFRVVIQVGDALPRVAHPDE